MIWENVKAFIFDWGGVLIENPSPSLFQFCSQELNVPLQDFTPLFSQKIKLFEKGLIDEIEMWQQVAQELNSSVQIRDSLWYRAVQNSFVVQNQVFQSVSFLRSKGFKVGFLSNTEMPAVNYFYQDLKWDQYFDSCSFSCLEKKAKPEAPIYLDLAERLGVKASECVMIDDKIENVQGAHNAGLQGYLFTSPSEYLKDFEVVLKGFLE